MCVYVVCVCVCVPQRRDSVRCHGNEVLPWQQAAVCPCWETFVCLLGRSVALELAATPEVHTRRRSGPGRAHKDHDAIGYQVIK